MLDLPSLVVEADRGLSYGMLREFSTLERDDVGFPIRDDISPGAERIDVG